MFYIYFLDFVSKNTIKVCKEYLEDFDGESKTKRKDFLFVRVQENRKGSPG